MSEGNLAPTLAFTRTPTTHPPAQEKHHQPAAKPTAKRPVQSPPALFHKPEGELGPLSNWWVQPFQDDKVVYTSVEQYLMHNKMLTFNQQELAAKIMEEHDPKTIKALGRTQISNYDDSIWAAKRAEVLSQGVWLKFSQNTDLTDVLLGTGSATIGEASRDPIYGIGMYADDPHASSPGHWPTWAKNLLGKTLMAIRDRLRIIHPCLLFLSQRRTGVPHQMGAELP